MVDILWLLARPHLQIFSLLKPTVTIQFTELNISTVDYKFSLPRWSTIGTLQDKALER